MFVNFCNNECNYHYILSISIFMLWFKWNFLVVYWSYRVPNDESLKSSMGLQRNVKDLKIKSDRSNFKVHANSDLFWRILSFTFGSYEDKASRNLFVAAMLFHRNILFCHFLPTFYFLSENRQVSLVKSDKCYPSCQAKHKSLQSARISFLLALS